MVGDRLHWGDWSLMREEEDTQIKVSGELGKDPIHLWTYRSFI